ncbi:hypothetical protein B0H12DRAFT_591412 [Mycena haematopus]|nr:hypothetical protein B0H12DRAFT_591412 [Mycena haematopus]
MKVHDTVTSLRNQNQATQRAYEDLKLRYDTMSAAFNTLVTAVRDRLSLPASSTSGLSSKLLPLASPLNNDHLRILERKDYPAIEFWTEDEYLTEEAARKKTNGKATMSDLVSLRGSKRLAEDNKNVMMWFVQDKDGHTVSGKRVKTMRNEARKVWKYLNRLGKLPEQWSSADSEVRGYYASEMRRLFPELQLCELDYKSHRIATIIYSAWSKKYVKPGIKMEDIKAEDADDTDDDDDEIKAATQDPESAGQKRSAPTPPDPQPVSKKSKQSTSKSKVITSNATRPKPKPIARRPRASLPSTAASPSGHPSSAAPAADPSLALASTASSSTLAPSTSSSTLPLVSSSPQSSVPPPTALLPPLTASLPPSLPTASLPLPSPTASLPPPPPMVLLPLPLVAPSPAPSAPASIPASLSALSPLPPSITVGPSALDILARAAMRAHDATSDNQTTSNTVKPVTSTPAVAAAGPGPSTVANPLAYLGNPSAPTTRTDFITGSSKNTSEISALTSRF